MPHRSIGTAITAATLAAMAPAPALAQTQLEETRCSAAYSAGDWRLDVDFSDDAFNGPLVRYIYTHEPSGFGLDAFMYRESAPRFGFETASLLDTPEIAAYFEDVPRHPSQPDDVFPPSYRGELTFLLVDSSEPWSWIAIGEVAYGFDPYVQDAAWIFLPGPQNERNFELVRNLTTIASDDIEVTLEFRPEGGSASVLRRISMSNTGLVALAQQSSSYVQAIMERCPLASDG